MITLSTFPTGPITPPCAICGAPTAGEFYDSPRRHYCNRCGGGMEDARFSAAARLRWRVLRLFLRFAQTFTTAPSPTK